MIFIVIDSVAAAALGFFTLYLAVLTVFALFARKRSFGTPSVYRRIAVVVPAHDEEPCIARTVRSLFAVRYPRDRYEVVVVADNCTDRTAAIARAEGATVLERTDTQRRGKGYALRWAFDRLLAADPAYDALAVVDADSTVAAGFLDILNHYLLEGSSVVQVSDLVEPQPGAWSSEVTRFGFTLYNYVRPLGRKLIGGTAGVRGNGVCFSTLILKEIPWNTYSLNEDLEYGLVLMLRGIGVDFAPEASVHASMPSDANNAVSQRSRWEGGRFPVIRKYVPLLLGEAFRLRSLKPIDALVELITPPFVNLFAAVMLCTTLNIFLLIFGVSWAQTFALIWLAVTAAGVFHVIVGLAAAGADRELYKVFLHIPRYAVWKIGLYAKHIGPRSKSEWVRTARDGPAAPGVTENITPHVSITHTSEDHRHV